MSAATLEGIVINGQIRLPGNLTDMDAFRRWARSDACPERGYFGFLGGVLHVDLSPEELYTHNQVKMEFTRVLGTLVKEMGIGHWCRRGVLFSHPDAGLSTTPDAFFVSYAALRSGRIRELPDARGVGVVELEGTLEMVLEVVGDSSMERDTIILPALYHAAGVDEFWRADVRVGLTFEIFRWRGPGYEAMNLPDGWWRSELFGRDFRLTQDADPLGDPMYTLHVRG